MTIYYIHPQQGSNSNDGLSSGSPKASPPAIGNGDTLRFAYGSTYIATSQWSWGTATGITLEAYGDSNLPLPIISITAAATNALNIQGDGTHIIRYIHFKNITTNNGGGAIGLGLVAATSKCAVGKITNCKFENISHNAIRLGNGSTSDAAPTFYCADNTFFNIGEDCIFGGSLVFEVARNTAKKISTNTATGDFVGYLQCDPSFAWIHDNYIDHSDIFCKHCIIIDSSTGSGFTLIEGNVVIGAGGWTGSMGDDPDGASTVTHTAINIDCPGVIRRNLIRASTIAIYTSGAGTIINSNVILPVNGNTTRPLISLSANNCKVYHNTISSLTLNTQGIYAVVQASGTSGHEVKNNIFKGVNIAVKSNQVGSNPTCSNNCFSNVTTKYQISTPEDFSGSSDLVEDPVLDSGFFPTNADLWTAGTFVEKSDFYGGTFPISPTIGAVQKKTISNLRIKTGVV